MLKRFVLVAFWLALAGVSKAATVPAPISITASPLYPIGAAALKWADDPRASQWNIYVNGKLNSSPDPTMAGLTGGFRNYTITNLPLTVSYVVVTMTAQYTGGSTPSAASSSVTITAYNVPFSYVVLAPGTPGSVSTTSAPDPRGTNRQVVVGDMWNDVFQGTATATSSTVTTINLTTTAAITCTDCGVGIKFQFRGSATAGLWDLGSFTAPTTPNFYQGCTTTPIMEPPKYVVGNNFFFKGLDAGVSLHYTIMTNGPK